MTDEELGKNGMHIPAHPPQIAVVCSLPVCCRLVHSDSDSTAKFGSKWLKFNLWLLSLGYHSGTPGPPLGIAASGWPPSGKCPSTSAHARNAGVLRRLRQPVQPPCQLPEPASPKLERSGKFVILEVVKQNSKHQGKQICASCPHFVRLTDVSLGWKGPRLTYKFSYQYLAISTCLIQAKVMYSAFLYFCYCQVQCMWQFQIMLSLDRIDGIDGLVPSALPVKHPPGKIEWAEEDTEARRSAARGSSPKTFGTLMASSKLATLNSELACMTAKCTHQRADWPACAWQQRLWRAV